jgi:hypothetical protein
MSTASGLSESLPEKAPISVDASQLSTVYANFSRVTSTPEELVLDFALNTQMAPKPSEPIKLTHRVVLTFYTAKRLLGALHMAIQQHEHTFGALELDVQKRARVTPAFRPILPPQSEASLDPVQG